MYSSSPAPELEGLRVRVQEFTHIIPILSPARRPQATLTLHLGREIPEEVAHETDQSNAMWQKLGDAGLLGIAANEEYGGLGMGYQTQIEGSLRTSGFIALNVVAKYICSISS
jgi:alkylation response protein AidB-like acyl-CoA dehydrogenase